LVTALACTICRETGVFRQIEARTAIDYGYTSI